MTTAHTRRCGPFIGAMFVLIAVFASPHVARAADDGGQPGAMLDWGIGARPVAMGGAFTAVAEGPTGYWWNPAGIAQVRDDGFEAAVRRMSFDRQAGYVSLVHPFGKEEAAMGVSWVYAGVGDVFSYDVDGNRGDKISDFTNAVGFSFARRFTERGSPAAFGIGLNLRYIQHNIANINAYTVGIDLGTQCVYRFRRSTGPKDAPSEVRLGASVQRLNEKFSWTTTKYWIPQGEATGSSFDEKVPVVVRTGAAALFLKQRALVAFDLDFRQGIGGEWHAGAEYRLHPLLALRAGLDDGDVTFGAGLAPQVRPGMNVLIDYAYARQPDAIDPEHIFSIGLR
ncbi:MAG: PorV/PorQ family protein, partial [candidate division Zixibacteria bacterium]|nr:PorV/PorQ family protein [candidate division Zixibacteria bacterium]